MRTVFPLSAALLAASLTSGCAPDQRGRFAAAETSLKLSRVVLYRNGIGYFERTGPLSGQRLSIRCRKDQINDILKSLTVVDRRSGQALSVSMPLDPQRWQSAALAMLTPGQGNLAKVLDALRGAQVELDTAHGLRSGRVLLVEELAGEPPASGAASRRPDHRISLLSGTRADVVLLSQVRGLRFLDGDLAMQLHRSLDASAGEGMFKQVSVDVRLAGAQDHDLAISYVVGAPVWQPTYRIVLPDDGKADALLQGWAVVANTSGEDWPGVRMSLTAGAPLAFKYDLHSPREVSRQDLSARGLERQAQVAMGESSFDAEEDAKPTPPPASMPMAAAPPPAPARSYGGAPGGGGPRGPRYKKASKAKEKSVAGFDLDDLVAGEAASPAAPPPPPAVDLAQLQRSTAARAQARQVSGLTQFDLQAPVQVPDGTSTMVAVLNQTVPAEQTFVYRPGGSGSGYEQNPYRVVRFKNGTPFVLEPGPISIYAGGSFVGEGMSEAIAAGASVTIPFAVEPGIVVTSSQHGRSGEVRLVKMSGGTLELQSYQRLVTEWTVRGQKQDKAYRVLVRQGRAGGYELKPRPEGTEDLPDGYLIPVPVAGGKGEAKLEVTEQTPVRTVVSIWDGQAEKALTDLLAVTGLDAGLRAKLEPVLKLRRDIGQIDTQLDGLRRQQQALDQRASETRANLEAIKKDPRAAELRAKLSGRLEEFTREGDGLGRRIVELTSQRLEKKIRLDDLLQNFELSAPK